MRIPRKAGVLALGGLLVTGCAVGPLPDGTGPRTDQTSRGIATQPVSAQDAARLRRVIEPLARAADRPPARVTVGILSDRSINAANAGGGEFYVTRGLLDRATDEQLLAIMAHEVAHNDLVRMIAAIVSHFGLTASPVTVGYALLDAGWQYHVGDDGLVYWDDLLISGLSERRGDDDQGAFILRVLGMLDADIRRAVTVEDRAAVWSARGAVLSTELQSFLKEIEPSLFSTGRWK